MNDQQYKSYKRIHKYENASDIEKEKIKKETNSFKRYQKKAKQLVRKINSNIDIEDINSIDEEAITFEYASKKEINNAKVHKKRLKELKKRKDFE